jgi:thymidine kinase
VKRNLLEENGSDTNNLPKILTMDDVLKKAKRRHGINLDPKQTKAYEMICTTFMIKIINDRRAQFVGASNPEQTRKINEVIKGLESIGGKKQLIMFLTGPAGAGKTTAIKLAQTFCKRFSEACHIPFDQYSFYFTAYTGAAASEFGGITTLTALQIQLHANDISEATESTKSTLNRVKILIMDEISFMSVKQLQLISKRLQDLFCCTSPFGGLSIIFCGVFRQLEFESEKQLLYTTQSNMYFENLLNAALILENKHRFRDDPLYGEIMSDMWSEGLTSSQLKEINKRVVMDKRSLPDVFDDNCHYSLCLSHKPTQKYNISQ